MKFTKLIARVGYLVTPLSSPNEIAKWPLVNVKKSQLGVGLRVFMLAGLFIVAGQAHAGLFNDDKARKQIQAIDARVTSLEVVSKQQVRTLLDLQSQIEALNASARELRGQNEELVHSQQEAGKRQKDFYVDLDTRLRHFEPVDSAVIPSGSQLEIDGGNVQVVDDPSVVNRTFEAAHSLFKAASYQNAINAYQEFLKRFPDSVYVANAHYEMASAYFVLKDFKSALSNYRLVVKKYSFSSKVSEAMLGVADCQLAANHRTSARKTLKKLIKKYPSSDAASEAKKRLAKRK
ncbi:MAG: tol-pal system protein YbgF [Gallionellaceae bacterium]